MCEREWPRGLRPPEADAFLPMNAQILMFWVKKISTTAKHTIITYYDRLKGEGKRKPLRPSPKYAPVRRPTVRTINDFWLFRNT